MINPLLEPIWFFGIDGKYVPELLKGFDSYLQIAFFVITLFISIQAYKIYKLSKKKDVGLLALGFSFISFSYIVWSILNLSIIKYIGDSVCSWISICIVNSLIDFSIYIHMILFLTGLLTLAYISLKVKSLRTYILLWGIILSVILFSIRTLFFFYFLSSILLFYLIYSYSVVYIRKRQRKSLFMAVSFICLALGDLVLLIGLSGGFYYITGNFLILVGYLVLLADLVSVIRK
ncbi:MAG: hypothetical protein ABIG95_02905 [Candidatus Woesearchaeota archaeon]